MNSHNDIIVMLIIGILSGLLSTMNVWANKLDDIRISINDVYMSTLMTGWMFLFYGLYYKITSQIYLGAIMVTISFICIRSQFLVDKNNFINGMIPHHSMAIFMSKKLKSKNKEMTKFLDKIIDTQENEINEMKAIPSKIDHLII